MRKYILCLILIVLVIFDQAPSAFAETAQSASTATVIDKGVFGSGGDNLEWTLSEDGVLTISGSGGMGDYLYLDWGEGEYPVFTPWLAHLSEITQVIINPGVSDIGAGAFALCAELVSVEIPDTVTSIGRWAFEECAQLEQINLPQSVTVIGDEAFGGCGCLKSIVLPTGLSSVSDYTFVNCHALETVTFSSMVTQIGCGAFLACESLKDIYFGGTEAQWAEVYINNDYDYNIKFINPQERN